MVCDGRGRVIHANTALESLMRSDPERGRLYGEVRRIAEALVEPASPEQRLATPVRCTIRTTETTYRLEGNYLAEDDFRAGAAILVAVHRTTPVMPADEDIRTRFGLTRKETAVTRLLAEGNPNDAIAAALYISPHTARRHTESIMRKLGVVSRAEIGPLLLRLTATS
jgi:DNA-binding CsgD family transcriptional regulator